MSSPFHSYVPPGQVGAAFLSCDEFVRAMMGPVGSGKTGCCLMDPMYRAMRQDPHPRDQVRRTKWAVIRDSYRQLEKTTIKSWHRWFPAEMPGSHWVGGSGGQPATHTLQFALPDGTRAHTIMEFIGLGDNAAEAVMPGWEGTGAYMNEADKLTRDTLTYVIGRVGRYPAVDDAVGFDGATWRGVWLDFNAPDTEHWLYKDFVEHPEPGWRFFQQPGAMIEVAGRYVVNPAAENLRNLVKGYYDQQISGQPRWYIRRMVLNKWGASRDGQPVYEEFNDDLHVAPRDLEPVPGLPLILGADAGLTPAIVILQQMPNGQWRVLDELVAPPTGMGAIKFGQLLNMLLAERYSTWAPQHIGHNGGPRLEDEVAVSGWADPAGAARASTDEQSWLQVMQATTGIPFRPAPTNNLTPRLEAVRLPLTRLIDGQPGLLISPRCKILRKGFNSGYRLKRMQMGDAERFSDEPEKNEFSHVHDALQYPLLGSGGHLQVLGRQTQAAAARRQSRAIDDDYPQGEWGNWDGRQSHAVD